MINKIRRKFIVIALLALTLAIVLVSLIINAANWVSVRGELHETLDYLLQHDGVAPGGRGMALMPGGGRRHGMQRRVNESRYFTVLIAPDGSYRLGDVSREQLYSASELEAIAGRALGSGKERGFCEDYCYAVAERNNGSRFAVFLNCETRLAALRSLARISGAACLGAVLLAGIAVALCSRRAIRPLSENIARQKRFITDAGHELRTPLTVISANMDVLALETGENKWIASTRKQLANLRGLVGELIDLSRLDEEDVRLQLTEFDLAPVLAEVTEPFAGMAEFWGKSIRVTAPASLPVRADAAALRRLLSLLCDNAVKYAPEGDEIQLTLQGSGRKLLLQMENGLKEPLSEETIAHLFDRFYRADASRARESGGYGIGLSVALAIAQRHGGDLRAQLTPQGRLRFSCTLPILRKKGRQPASGRETEARGE